MRLTFALFFVNSYRRNKKEKRILEETSELDTLSLSVYIRYILSCECLRSRRFFHKFFSSCLYI